MHQRSNDVRTRAALWTIAALAAAGTAHARGTPWQLVWSDEFNGTSLDRVTWEPQTGTGTAYGLPAGWGNNELQFYTDLPANLSVSGGNLRIVARQQFFGGSTYTSARIRTLNSFATKYGRIEARIKIPSGQGIWPAFWMLPTGSPYGGWAASGEIDIMESTNAADRIYGTIHYGGQFPANTSNGGSFAPGTDFGAGFFLYAVEWEPDQIRWYVDNTLIHTATSATWFSSNAPTNDRAPFDVPFHLILNIAVGGNFPGPPNGGAGFPMEMTVDYVRVYQRQQLPFTIAGTIPGRIEAENFDQGGPGVAYNDIDSTNSGGQYRTSESVDIETSTEGAFNVGFIRQGEWIEYTVEVDAPGYYRLDSRLAAQNNGGTLHIEFDGVDRSGPIAAPITGGWQTWTTVTSTVGVPAQGPSVMRFVNDSPASGEFNVNWFRFVLLAEEGDVNADLRTDIDDLYSFEQGGGMYRDVDFNGAAGTPADRARLIELLRSTEPDAGL